MSRPPQPLAPAAGWAALGVLAVCVAAGVARRLPDDVLIAVLGTAVALAAGAVATVGPPRLRLPAVAVSTAGAALLCNGTSSDVGWFAVPVLAGWCALTASRNATIGYAVGAVVLFGGEAVFASSDPGWAAWIGGTAFSAVGCLFARRQRDLVEQLHAAQAGLAARAQAEERNRIARELHDVIAHSLTVSLLHVSSARLALADDPEDAARALAEAERLGRASLDEVRHAVGLLRTGDLTPDPTTPLPGSIDVPVLFERFRAAGLDVRSRVDGSLERLPATVALAVYRILQEAVTNAAKHAPGSQVSASVRVGDAGVEVDVDSAGSPGLGHGLGLLGMQERAAALGGSCTAGPGGAGWRVHATLPLAPAR